tara:strand:- start:89 stop:682 length:594 start_codon:yes stop_codon:yes gene_type:complete
MYKKFLYNDDCVLDLKLNKVIYEFDEEYQKYLEWKGKNPNLDYIATKERDGKLRWNQGVPLKVDNEELYYQVNGKLFQKKIYHPKTKELITEQEYFTNDELNFDAEIVYKELKYKDGLLTDDLRYYYFPRNIQSHTIFYYDKNKMISYYKKELDIQGNMTGELECKLEDDKTLYKETLFDTIGNVLKNLEWEEKRIS